MIIIHIFFLIDNRYCVGGVHSPAALGSHIHELVIIHNILTDFPEFIKPVRCKVLKCSIGTIVRICLYKVPILKKNKEIDLLHSSMSVYIMSIFGTILNFLPQQELPT